MGYFKAIKAFADILKKQQDEGEAWHILLAETRGAVLFLAKMYGVGEDDALDELAEELAAAKFVPPTE